jgi:hypothetical protein
MIEVTTCLSIHLLEKFGGERQTEVVITGSFLNIVLQNDLRYDSLSV